MRSGDTARDQFDRLADLANLEFDICYLRKGRPILLYYAVIFQIEKLKSILEILFGLSRLCEIRQRQDLVQHARQLR